MYSFYIDESFMRQISLLMTHQLFLSGQYIWSQGVVKSGMLCIKRGVVEMLSDEDDESPMISFKEGTVSNFRISLVKLDIFVLVYFE